MDKSWKSLRLLKEVLIGLGEDDAKVQETIGPVEELNLMRSKISGHASVPEAKQIKAKILKEHKTYAAHFHHLCAKCDAAVRRLEVIL